VLPTDGLDADDVAVQHWATRRFDRLTWATSLRERFGLDIRRLTLRSQFRRIVESSRSRAAFRSPPTTPFHSVIYIHLSSITSRSLDT